MITTPEISIIVPVYKVEKYLRECLASILAQTYKDWECILVDDGSPDNSVSICEEFVSKDSRFKLIRRQNGGLSAARNTGLSSARGKYIAFVDSDDVVYLKYLERLHELITANDADVAQVSYELLFTTFVRKRVLVDSVTVHTRGGVAMEMMRDKKIPSYMWNKLFKREVIDTPFPEGKLYEDMYALSSWVRNIARMVVAPDVLYSYRQRRGSIVNSGYAHGRIEYIWGVIQKAESLRKLEPLALSDEYIDNNMWRGLVRAGKNIARNSSDTSEAKEAILQLSKIGKTIPTPTVKGVGLKTWWRSHLLRDNPMWFMHIMSIDRNVSASYRRSNNYLFD